MMLLTFLLVICVCGRSIAEFTFPESWEEFEQKYQKNMDHLFRDFRTEFLKKYNDKSHEAKHFATFVTRVKGIFDFNAEKKSWYKGINRFSDLSDEERQQYVMPETKTLKNRKPLSGGKRGYSDIQPKSKPLNGAGDSSICDLRPFMTSVKNQGSCGSCWAFGTMAAAEAAHQLWSMTDANGNAVPSSYNNAWQLSEQNIIECCGSKYDSNGCGGGGVSGPLQCAVDMGSLMSTVSHPYLATTANTTCNAAGSPAAAVVEQWFEPCANGDEDCVKSYIGGDSCTSFYTTALKTSIEVISSFYDYAGGVYSDPACPDTIHNHAVAIVGWGTDASGIDYWIVRNSWGSDWGLGGYIYMQRGTNMCCIGCENLFFQ